MSKYIATLKSRSRVQNGGIRHKYPLNLIPTKGYPSEFGISAGVKKQEWWGYRANKEVGIGYRHWE